MSSAFPGNGPVLVLETACRVVFVGLWRDGVWQSTRTVEAAALDVLFDAVEACLDEADCHLAELAAFAYDEGPGSVLGVRVAAMALRTWRALPSLSIKPVYAFRSLEVLAAQITSQATVSEFRIIADYRKNAWLSLRFPQGKIDVLAPGDIEPGLPLYYLKQRKAWTKPPVEATEVALDLLVYPDMLCDANLLSITENPGVFTVRPVEYKRWEPSA